MLGETRCDDPTTLERRLDPETITGWILLSCIWAWYAVRTLAHLRKPEPPGFARRTRLAPIHTGGSDWKYGNVRGGPQIFGGMPNDDSDCARGLSPIERVRIRMDREGRMFKVGYVLRRPGSYRGSPRALEALASGGLRERDTPSAE